MIAMSGLLAAFILLPILELAVLLNVSHFLGGAVTLTLLASTALIGALVLWLQGLSALAAIEQDIIRGRIPATPILDGVMILVAGMLLLTPGLITDILGLVMLMPGTRSLVRKLVRRRIERRLLEGPVPTSLWRW